MSFYREYLASPAWQRRRLVELERTGHRCEDCGHTEHLEVHHNNYLRVGRERPGDVRVLCSDCHGRVVHGRRQYEPIESIQSILPRVFIGMVAPSFGNFDLVGKD